MYLSRNEGKTMRAELFKEPDDYLIYFEQVLDKAGIFESSVKIANFYDDLQEQFKEIYYNKEVNQFMKWGKLLAIDAKLHILLELIAFTKLDIPFDFRMSEEDIIQTTIDDHKTYYSELTEIRRDELPKRGLIYLSEEHIVKE